MLDKIVNMFKENETEETKVARENAAKLAKDLLPLLGGKENIVVVDHCTTRLRLEVKDSSLIAETAIKNLVYGFLNLSKTSVQVIVRKNPDLIADELKKLLEK